MTNTTQLIVLFINGVPNASQNTLDINARNGLTVTPGSDGAVTFTLDGAASGYYPYSGAPSGSIPGRTFEVPFDLALATVFVNGLALLPSSYSQSGDVFTLSTPLVEGDTIYICGFYLYSA